MPEALCTQIEQFNHGMRSKVNSFGLYVNMNRGDSVPNWVEKEFAEWNGASKYFDTEVPLARIALETELRSIFSANTRNFD